VFFWLNHGSFTKEFGMNNNAQVIINDPSKMGIFDLERLHTFKTVLQVLIFAAVCASLAMELPQVKPLKISSVYLHEQGHAIMAFLTNGKVVGMKINAENESGETSSLEGNITFVDFSGYIFQCLVGALALASSYRQKSGMRFCVLLGFLTLGSVVAFLGESPDIPTVQCGILIIMGCVGTGFLCWSRPLWHFGSMFLRVIGTFWSSYTIFDIFHDCFESSGSDAHALAAHLGMVPWFFGIIFLAMGILATVFAAYRSALPEPQPQPVKRRTVIAVHPRM